MSRSSKRLGACALLAGTMLGGCSDIYHDRRDTIALSAGDAIASNHVAQMVDPWPRSSARKDIAFDGQKMQTAVERYRTNQVIRPASAVTSSAAYQSSAPSAAPPAPTSSAPPPPQPSTPPSFSSSGPSTVPAPVAAKP
jgi:hypothetical protein